MKTLLIFSVVAILSGCAKVFNGNGKTKYNLDAKVGKYDDSYYLPTLAEIKRFNVKHRNAIAGVRYSKHWDCDDFARDWINSVNKVYSAYPSKGESIATQLHIIVVVETSDCGLVYVEPQNGKILNK